MNMAQGPDNSNQFGAEPASVAPWAVPEPIYFNPHAPPYLPRTQVGPPPPPRGPRQQGPVLEDPLLMMLREQQAANTGWVQQDQAVAGISVQAQPAQQARIRETSPMDAELLRAMVEIQQSHMSTARPTDRAPARPIVSDLVRQRALAPPQRPVREGPMATAVRESRWDLARMTTAQAQPQTADSQSLAALLGQQQQDQQQQGGEVRQHPERQTSPPSSGGVSSLDGEFGIRPVAG